jgi:hypothetical protein
MSLVQPDVAPVEDDGGVERVVRREERVCLSSSSSSSSLSLLWSAFKGVRLQRQRLRPHRFPSDVDLLTSVDRHRPTLRVKGDNVVKAAKEKERERESEKERERESSYRGFADVETLNEAQ